MKALRIILGLISMGLTVLCFDSPSEYSQAIAPFVLPLAGMALGAIGNLFSGSGRKKITKEDLIKMGWKPYDAEKAISRLARRTQASLKQKRAYSGAKAKSLGLDPISSSNYGNEAGIHEAAQVGYGQIEDKVQEDKSNMTKTMLEYNMNIPEEESTLSKILGGATGGANLGFAANNALGVNIPATGEGGDTLSENLPSLTDKTGSILNKFLNDRPKDSPVSGDALQNRLQKEEIENIGGDNPFKDVKLPWKSEETGDTSELSFEQGLGELPKGELSQILGSTLPQWAQWNKINPRGRKPFLNYLKDLKGANVS